MAESIAPIPLTVSGFEQIFPEPLANRAFRCAYPVHQFRAFWTVTKRFRWLRISGKRSSACEAAQRPNSAQAPITLLSSPIFALI